MLCEECGKEAPDHAWGCKLGKGYRKGEWRRKDRKRPLNGWWLYCGSDRFWIILKSKDPITGFQRSFSVCGDTPEWDKWKLVRE